MQTIQVTLSFSTNAGQDRAVATSVLLRRAVHSASRSRVPSLSPRAHVCTPLITFLPFLDFCTLWLLQDPMRPHNPAARAPSHGGWVPEKCTQFSQDGQPLLHSHKEGTTQAELRQPSSPWGMRRGEPSPVKQWCHTGGGHQASHTDNPWTVSHYSKAKQRTTDFITLQTHRNSFYYYQH